MRTDTPKPEAAEPPLALLRIEERIERVPITSEQVHERMRAAAGVLDLARQHDLRIVTLTEELKSEKKASGAKHAEAEQIILDAREGMTNVPFPVIIERHLAHPAEMRVWRVPCGVDPEQLKDLPEVPQSDEDLVRMREDQGCTLHETRAMSPDELAAAEAADHAHKNPELPFAQGEGSKDEVHGCLECKAGPGEPHADTCDDAGSTVPTVEQQAEQQERAEQAVAPKRQAPRCPYVIEQADEPNDDRICGADGSTRAKGFCAEHYEELGGKKGSHDMTRMLLRRKARQLAARAAAEREHASDDGPEVGKEPDDDEQDGAAEEV